MVVVEKEKDAISDKDKICVYSNINKKTYKTINDCRLEY